MRFIITGANGRMGKSLVTILKEEGHKVIELNRSASLKEIKKEESSVVIDFSSPNYFNSILEWSVENKTPFVSGTTGLSNIQFKSLEEAGTKIPVLWAPNMSLGVAFVNKLIKSFSEISEDFDFQVEELHHRHKVDKPSGTGIFLQETLKKAVKKEVPEVISVRGGGIFGVHKIWAMAEGETITLEHQALSRDVFSKGAIKCAKWLIDRPVAVYKIGDILG